MCVVGAMVGGGGGEVVGVGVGEGGGSGGRRGGEGGVERSVLCVVMSSSRVALGISGSVLGEWGGRERWGGEFGEVEGGGGGRRREGAVGGSGLCTCMCGVFFLCSLCVLYVCREKCGGRGEVSVCVHAGWVVCMGPVRRSQDTVL